MLFTTQNNKKDAKPIVLIPCGFPQIMYTINMKYHLYKVTSSAGPGCYMKLIAQGERLAYMFLHNMNNDKLGDDQWIKVGGSMDVHWFIKQFHTHKTEHIKDLENDDDLFLEMI